MLAEDDPVKMRMDIVDEQIDAVGSAFLGVTLGCARCHDHKFDPIRQSDYYRIQAYFAATHDNDVVRASEQAQAAWKEKAQAVQSEMKQIRAKMRGMKGEERTKLEKQL